MNTKWCSHYENQYGGSPSNFNNYPYMNQQFQSGYIHKIYKTKSGS